MPQPGFFDVDERLNTLNQKDPWVNLNRLIDWENFRDSLHTIREKDRKNNAGRKPFDVVIMFTILVLQY